VAGEHSRRETTQDLPRLLQIEVGGVPAHLSDERVRGDSGDGVDARDAAGDGYKYLLRTVAAGDGGRSLPTPLTRYYAEAGIPPGRWLGSHRIGSW